MNDDRIYKAYEKEIGKDKIDLDKAKKAYISTIKNGLGDEINDFNNYIKKEPSKWVKFKNFISKIFKYI